MPILDLPASLPTAYRLRLGRKVNGRPSDLDGAIRVTSPIRSLVEQIAKRYEGTPVALVDIQGATEAETVLPPKPLPIVLLPGQVVTQWWEKWGKTGCDRRCDGEWDQITGEACVCPPVGVRMRDRSSYCQPTTRLTLILPRLDSPVAGRLDSTGRIFAESMMGTNQLLAGGAPVRAMLNVRKRKGGRRQFVYAEVILGRPVEGPLLENRTAALGQGTQSGSPEGDAGGDPATVTVAPPVLPGES